jgi:hypothetical protein
MTWIEANGVNRFLHTRKASLAIVHFANNLLFSFTRNDKAAASIVSSDQVTAASIVSYRISLFVYLETRMTEHTYKFHKFLVLCALYWFAIVLVKLQPQQSNCQLKS